VEAFCLSRVRFQEMSLRQPALAVETLRALGAVLVGRQTALGLGPARSLPLAA
jgi:methenyltetrahydromethanopterin cyclohydrolase